ncbi:hypothetical protein TNCV_1358581 [Trichonephila clavipes]|uniref:Uncharacterized protein n=1 Tax=Trichonephila clavipes TaxID=2585209 RepID=A0A8X6VIE4_TRICX|nr:hypothetical protein TNCV_1358581 [Trichonephila clavipes]
MNRVVLTEYKRRSNESQDGKKKGSEVKREYEEKGLYFINDQERKVEQKKTVTLTTSRYNLRPRNGKGVESRPTIERKTQQGGPVRSRKGRGGTIVPASKNEQDQATRMPDEEVINKGKTRKGEKRVRKSLCPWRFW